MNSEFNVVGLYEHNASSYKKIKSAFNSGENVVGIVHATGTGKTYNALQLAYDNKEKKIVYIVPSNGIIEHIKSVIESNTNLDINRDFSNLEIRTYQSFISMSKEEIKNMDIDYIVLDEFHHIGSPIWGNRVNTIIETHPNIKVFGMTAYTVRDRGTIYERDMANSDKEELFSNKIVSRYDLCDAMIDGVLPKPIYKSAHANLIEFESKLEEKIRTMNTSTKEYEEYEKILKDVKRRIHEAPSIKDVVKKNIKSNGKYIYFCPPIKEERTNDMETIMEEAKTWFLEMGLKEEDIVFYKTKSDMGELGKKNREAFYNDVDLNGNYTDDKLRVMFAVNQYNEGVHAPNVDGVIMGRETTSDIVYFEQLGRALSVKGETQKNLEEYEKCSKEVLLEICKAKEIKVSNELEREEIIQKLLAPVIIDLVGNYDFIKELENNLKDRVKEIQSRGLGEKREIKIRNVSFDIEMENQDIYETLKYVFDRLNNTWEMMYNLAREYYNHHGNLLIPHNFKTKNGYEYDEEGVNLGTWIKTQRQNYHNLSKEKQDKLKEIGFVINANEEKWNMMYNLAREYYNHHGNLLIPNNFKTKNGYEYDEEGVNLGIWLRDQRQNYDKLSKEKQDKLKEIGFVMSTKEEKWNMMYNLAREYYNHHGNLLIPNNFKTKNGYEYDEEGVNLGTWINFQRQNYDKLSKEKQDKLKEIGFVMNAHEEKWNMMYNLAVEYYNHHGNLLIPHRFKTKNGYEYDEEGFNLGFWIVTQRQNYHNLPKEKQDKLKEIGFVMSTKEEKWNMMYNLACEYYNHHGNLLIPQNFKTKNGYEYDEEGFNLGVWLVTQRQDYHKLSKEKQDKLKEIGFVMNAHEEKWNMMYNLAREYYNHHGNLLIPNNFKTKNGYEYDEEGVNLGTWLKNQKINYENLSEDKKILLEQIGMIWNIRKNRDLIKGASGYYGIDYKLNKDILDYITLDELEVKRSYLLDNNIEFIDNNGKLHEIFSMSNRNMIDKYNISLEELVDKYSKTKEKGV